MAAAKRTARAAGLGLLLAVIGGCAYLVRDVSNFYMKVRADLAGRDIEIQLTRSFIKKYMNRVDIATLLTVDKAMQRPNPRLLDGDLHFAGRAPEIGLPVVAEIANARSAPEAMDLVHRLGGTGRPVKIRGVWRIWAEHAGRMEEDQGEGLDPQGSENPGHVFEIHPVMRIGGLGLSATFRPIRGFAPNEARRTFRAYQGVPCRITAGRRTISFVTRKGVDNNVEFVMRVVGDRQIRAQGGRFVVASALDLGGDVLVERLRMVFADDTPPERAVRRLKRGGRLHVYGLPRVDLAEIWRRVKLSRKDPAVLDRPLPYEIIIQGVYDNE